MERGSSRPGLLLVSHAVSAANSLPRRNVLPGHVPIRQYVQLSGAAALRSPSPWPPTAAGTSCLSSPGPRLLRALYDSKASRCEARGPISRFATLNSWTQPSEKSASRAGAGASSQSCGAPRHRRAPRRHDNSELIRQENRDGAVWEESTPRVRRRLSARVDADGAARPTRLFKPGSITFA